MRGRFGTGILWLATVATAIFIAAMVVSTVRAEAGRPAPTMTSCRDVLLTSARIAGNGRPARIIGPADRAAQLARTTAATVHGMSRDSRDGGSSYVYSGSDLRAIVVVDNTGRAIAVLSRDGDLSASRLKAMVRCAS